MSGWKPNPNPNPNPNLSPNPSPHPHPGPDQVDLNRLQTLWRENKFTFGMYLGYMGLMLTLGAAEGLMASVVVYYIARLAGAPLSDTGRPLKRPLIFEKLIAKTPAALQENNAP